jgi:hypothetical protein
MQDVGDRASNARASILIPSWCEHWRGGSALLLVAPHGGRRAPVNPLAPPSNLRVNDLYTAEITRLLARQLHAGGIVNGCQDRNLLDLNRTSQVRRRARWYLELLVREIDAILSAQGAAEVVVVHGWNTGQPRCDLGVGAIETGSGLQVSDGARLTVSREYLDTRLAALRAGCARAGITASLGARYPASHPNNLLQLFSAHDRHPDDALVRQIATWAAQGRLNAWQLELGIPLRWPGAWRDRFVRVMLETFGATGGSTPPPRSRASTPATEPIPESHASPATLQFYDPAADLGVFAGVGPLGTAGIAGRLLLFLGGQRVALFTGEAMRPQCAAVPPVAFAWGDGRLRMDFDGPMLLLEDAVTYLDLEVALATSRLVEATAALEFSPTRAEAAGGVRFGAVEGVVVLDGRRQPVRTAAFANAGILRAHGSRRQSMIAAAFDDGGAVLSRAAPDAGEGTALCFAGQGVRRLGGVRIHVTADGDQYLPDLLELTCDDEAALQAAPLSHMAILRGVGGGRYLRVSFGIARCRWGARAGYGVYEYARPLPSPA